MRMMSIASGSSGNCIYIGSDNTHILIDDGISKKRVLEGLKALDLTADDLDAILITHEHDDHIHGLGVLERHKRMPIYGTSKVLSYIQRSKSLGQLPEGICTSFSAGDCFTIKDLTIQTVPVSHDALDPVAYVVSSGIKKAGVITDLGVYNEEIVEAFSGLNTLLIESNHDVNMLMTGPYPYPLKQRILGTRGHLSNEDCGRLLGRILNDNIQHLYLGHLSKENNFPELAFETVRLEIDLGDHPYQAKDFNIQVAKRDMPSDIIYI